MADLLIGDKVNPGHNSGMNTQTDTPLGSHKLIAFVAATNANRAREFYGGTLGLRFVSEDGFAVVFDAHGTMLRVSLAKTLTPAPFTVLGWETPDIEATVARLETAGVKFNRYGLPGQDERGIWSAPGGAKVLRRVYIERRGLNIQKHSLPRR